VIPLTCIYVPAASAVKLHHPQAEGMLHKYVPVQASMVQTALHDSSWVELENYKKKKNTDHCSVLLLSNMQELHTENTATV
jgi:hypothetical protein